MLRPRTNDFGSKGPRDPKIKRLDQLLFNLLLILSSISISTMLGALTIVETKVYFEINISGLKTKGGPFPKT